MLVAIVFLTLVNLAVLILVLSAVGNSLTTLRTDIAEGFSHQVWQHRVTRRAITSECKKIEGYREPPTINEELDAAMTAFSAQMAKRDGQ